MIQFIIPTVNYEKKSSGLENVNDSKAFIEYSNDMDPIYKDIEEYNPNKERKMLIAFVDMITDIVSELIITERAERILNIYFVFITQSYFAVPKNIKLNSKHYFIMNVPNKWEPHQIAFNYSSDIDFKYFMNLYIKCTPKQNFLLVIHPTLAPDNTLCFRKNLLERI